MNGSSDCDPTVLQQAEAVQVSAANHQRNLERCLNGASSCVPTELKPQEAASVEVARKRRNLADCVNGFFSKCDLSLLTAPDLGSVAAAQQNRMTRRGK
jgi:hypothetical protein